MDDDAEEYDSEDIEEIEEKCLAELRSGKLIVKNSEGTLRCPYSPSRKKQAYPYKDLLQHAEGVAKGKRGAEAAGKHRALQTFLLTDLASLKVPPVERVHKLELIAPQRRDAEDLLVFPWSGVIYNIDNKARSASGLSVGPGVADIRQHFAVFNPDKAHVFWGPRGHMGMGVVTFRRDLEGLKDAQAFEKWFIEKGHSRRDWERRRGRNDRDGLGTELYGWLARKEDYEGRRETKDDGLVAKYLQDTGDLKDVGMVGEEMNKIHDQRFKSLAETVTEKNKEFQNLLTESEVARRNAEYVKMQLEEKHKQELEEVKNKAKQSTEQHTKAMHEHNQILQSSMEALQKRCKDLEDKEKDLRNQADIAQLEKEKDKNRLQLDMVNQQTKIQKKHQADQVKLIKKHEEESKDLELWIQKVKLQLATRQEIEIDRQRLGEKIETEKFKGLAESLNVPGEAHESNTKELQDKIKSMEDQKAELEGQLDDLKSENDTNNNTINVLATKERHANDELEDARRLAVKALAKHGSEPLVLKRMGEIDKGPWRKAIRQKYRAHEDGWEMVLSTMLSSWEAKLQSNDFYPYKTVQIKEEEDKWERITDYDNPELKELRDDLGMEVCETVVTALKEIEEYNASGRYSVVVPWNCKLEKRATMTEVIQLLLDLLNPKKKRGLKRPAPTRT